MNPLTVTRVSIYCSSCSKLVSELKVAFWSISKKNTISTEETPVGNKPSLGMLAVLSEVCWVVCEAKYVGRKTNAHQLRICMFSWKYSMSYCYELTICFSECNTRTACQLVSIIHWKYNCVQEFCCCVALIECHISEDRVSSVYFPQSDDLC